MRPSPIALLALLSVVLTAGAAAASASADSPGEVTTFHVPVEGLSTEPKLVTGPGNGTWFYQNDPARIGFLGSAGGVSTTALPPIGGGEHFIGSMVVGPDGTIWLALQSLIGRISPDGTFSTFPVAERFSEVPANLTLGPDGDLWFTLATGFGSTITSRGTIVRLTATGQMVRIPMPNQVLPQDIAFDDHGNLWYTGVEGRASFEHYSRVGIGSVGELETKGQFHEWRLPAHSTYPSGITLGDDGNLWFLQTLSHSRGAAVGRVTPGGHIDEFRTGPNREQFYGQMVTGFEGDMWFSSDHGLGRITPTGQITTFPNSETGSVSLGAEGDIWFSTSPGRIRRMIPGAPGIQIISFDFSRRTRYASAQLACGGSESDCSGALNISPAATSLRGSIRRAPAREIRPVRIAYRVHAEANRTIRFRLPDRSFAQTTPREPLGFVVRASVHGGPTAKRVIWLGP